MTTHPIGVELLRGLAELERTERGWLPHRLPARGRWRETTAETASTPTQYGLRGRGIPLMRALADSLAINTSPQGTRVTLTWNTLLHGNRASVSPPFGQ